MLCKGKEECIVNTWFAFTLAFLYYGRIKGVGD
jgi:hypothetical protein